MLENTCSKIKKFIQNDDYQMWFLIVLLLAAVLFFVMIVVKIYSSAFGTLTFPTTAIPSNLISVRAEWGQIGDFFGGVLNPLFGFASLFALLVTIAYQARSLRVSSEELKLSREELSKSSTALASQNKAIELQSFEQTFFSWLNTYRSILSSIEDSSRYGEDPLNGRPQLFRWWEENLGFKQFFVYLRNHEDVDILNFPDSFIAEAHSLDPKDKNIKQFLLKSANDYRQDFTRIIIYKWSELYKEKEYQLDSFFRILYRLLVWIDSQHSNRLSDAQKWLYISIIRSQLSWIEMAYLYMNGLTKVGEKFKPLAEKYALFDNLTFDSDILLQILKMHLLESETYSPEAYSSEIAREKIGLPKSSEGTLALATATSQSSPPITPRRATQT